MSNIVITGVGNYLPKKRIFSLDLDKKLGLMSGTIEKKTGVISRHFASNHETIAYMGAQAALDALKDADVPLTDIDLIVAACGPSDPLSSCTASLIQKKLGLEHANITCFDINSTSLCFLTALDTMAHLINGNRYRRALIIASAAPSLQIDWDNDETCGIWGDGASACVIEKSDGSSRLLATDLVADSMVHTRDSVFHHLGIETFEIDWFVPHPASQSALHEAREALDLPHEKFTSLFATLGNQMHASIPSALHHLIVTKKLKRGQLVYLFTMGAGISSAGMLFQY